MKQRKQFIGAPPLVTRVRDAQRRVKALERAGTSIYNTLTIVEVDGYKHKPQPLIKKPPTKPNIPTPTPDIPGFWTISSYSLNFTFTVLEKTHIYVLVDSHVQSDTTHIFGGGSLVNYSPAGLITTDMSVNIIYDQTLNVGDSQHNNPETYSSDQYRIQIYECIALTDNASLTLDNTDNLFYSSAKSVTWTKPRNTDDPEQLGNFSILSQDTDEANGIGPVATATISVSVPGLAGDMTIVVGPSSVRPGGGTGTFISTTAIPILSDWDTVSGFGYSLQSTIETQTSSMSADFQVDDPGGVDGHHETFDSAFIVGMVLRHE